MEKDNKKNLETLIDETGIKREKIAELMNLSVSGFWRLRQNPKKMDSVQMERLAQALNVSVFRVFEAIQNSDG